MQKVCSKCDQPISYESGIPKFCSNCGERLSASESSTGNESSSSKDASSTTNSSQASKSNDDLRVDETATVFVARTPGEASRTKQANDDSQITLPRFLIEESTDENLIEAQRHIGPYEVQDELGRGGMGVVYRAVHRKNGQRVAIKLLNHSPGDNSRAAERFHRETLIAASISNPRSTFVYGSGEHEGRRYICMELMPGGTLKDIVLDEGKLPVTRAVDLILDVVDGIQSAHRRGIVHRDIKPSNCFVDHDDRVKVGDYGLSKSFESNVALTQTGAFMGTPQFAAPEQIRAGNVDERTDIYAIGATLFYMLSGRGPFEGDVAQVIAAIASEKPDNIRKHAENVPPRLARLIAQMLEKDPKNRPLDLQEVRRRLIPFATQGATVADLGRRFAAFFIDLTSANIISSIIVGLAAILIYYIYPNAEQSLTSWALVLTSMLAQVGYFAVFEGCWGRGLGKWLFGMRVVERHGGQPGLVKAFGRSLLIPGAMVAGNMILPLLLTGNSNGDPIGMDSLSFLLVQAAPVLGWVLALGLLTTARTSNGFLGVHEIATGTKVVRIGSSLSSVGMTEVPRSLPTHIPDREFPSSLESDELSIVGSLGKTKTGQVFLARDDDLERPLWLVRDPELSSAISENRLHVNRPRRQRLLAHFDGNDDPKLKDIVLFEAIEGAPFSDVITQARLLNWPTLRLLLEDLTLEIIDSLDDGTLPPSLSIGQVWLDAESNIKISDIDFRAAQQKSGKPESDWSNQKATIPIDEQAVEVVRQLLNLIARNAQLPGHVLDFQRALGSKAKSSTGRQTLIWIRNKLREFESQPSNWKWDDRLGTLVTSFSTEYVMYYLFVVVIGVSLKTFTSLDGFVFGGLLIFALLGISFVLGYLFEGGLAFRFCGVDVRKTATGQPASPVISGLRSMIAWLPVNLSTVSVVYYLLFWILDPGIENSVSATGNEIASFLGVLFLINVFFFATVVGLMHGLIVPARSIQDYICGTFLTRK